MLAPEEAARRLAAQEISGWRDEMSTRLGQLPEDLRWIEAEVQRPQALGAGILWGKSCCQRPSPSLQQFDALLPEQRRSCFDALLPKMGEALEQAWQLGKAMPYPGRAGPGCFRAPLDPLRTLEHRFFWVRGLVNNIGVYDPDVRWLAAWATYIFQGAEARTTAPLLAAAVDEGGSQGDEVFDILCDSARGVHPVGGMGWHVIDALLMSSRPDGWALLESLLLDAQREEGLRWGILRGAAQGHRAAFRRLVQAILDHDLVRFSSVVESIGSWLDMSVLAGPAAGAGDLHIGEVLRRLIEYLDDAAARQDALERGKPWQTYLALWAAAFEDVEQAIAPAARLLREGDAARRQLALAILHEIKMPRSDAVLVEALDHADPQIAVKAMISLSFEDSVLDEPADVFERLERLAKRLGRKRVELEPPLPLMLRVRTQGQLLAEALIKSLHDRPPTRLLPYLGRMVPGQRRDVVTLLVQVKPLEGAVRQGLLQLAGDRDGPTQEAALAALKKSGLTEADARQLEGHLAEKSDAVRLGLFQFLLGLSDRQVLDSARRLLMASKGRQRLGGLELLRLLVRNKRCVPEAQELARQFQQGRSELSEQERRQLEAIAPEMPKPAPPAFSRENGLGLINAAEVTRLPKPVKRSMDVVSPAGQAFLKSLDDLVHEHRETLVTVPDGESTRQEMLGNLADCLWHVRPDNDLQRLPLREIWEQWWTSRDAKLCDPDGLEFLRAMVQLQTTDAESMGIMGRLWQYTQGKRRSTWRYPKILDWLLNWFQRMYTQPGEVDFLLDGLETSLAVTPHRVLLPGRPAGFMSEDIELFGHLAMRALWQTMIQNHQQRFLREWTPPQRARLWRMQIYAGWHLPGWSYCGLRIEEVLAAHELGVITQDDIIAHLLMIHWRHEGLMDRLYHHDLFRLSGRAPHSLFKDHPYLAELVDRCRRRIVEVELQRGESDTPATPLALHLRYSGGMDVLVPLLEAMGKEKILRRPQLDNRSKSRVFTHLIEATAPGANDQPEEFARLVRKAGIREKRLLEVAMLTPQWASYVERALGWAGLADSVWWIHAHTRPVSCEIEPDEDRKAAWKAEVGRRTPVNLEDLAGGAVDLAWFHRAYGQLGESRWSQLDPLLLLASDTNGHARARLYADAMRGRLDRATLFERIKSKRHQDSVLAVGLLPLAEGDVGRRDMLERYEFLHEFRRGSRKFGPQRQASEKRAVEVAMQNLARAAGYPDPLRLEWAMEVEALADLAAGPVKVIVDQAEASMYVDEQGLPEIGFSKAGKPLKGVPAALKANGEFKALQERKTQLKRQASRTRASLETSMCRGDIFSGRELQDLCRHPILSPMLQRLVVVGEGILGYPVDGGRGLQNHTGRIEPVRPDESLRIAHPVDLRAGGQWHLWQRDCFARERVQPFKQIFRELYVPTEGEKQDSGRVSRRYEGQQVEPRKAATLLGGRQWLILHETGVQRTFHEADVTAWLLVATDWWSFMAVDSITLEGVEFLRRSDWTPIPLEQVPPRVFSEVMRDLDLVVSVAHRSGVDPEASTSTVQMRTALVQEACHLLGLENVRMQEPHILIDGDLGHYSVHLGSGVVHRQPGGMLFIVAVHSQQRGRLFLPFADDDPKTAEILSKVILLANDRAIKDPTILGQIRGQGQ